MTDEELVKLIQQGIDVKSNMEQLYMQTKGFISYKAKKYKGITEIEELMQEGYIALDNAVKEFDAFKYNRFIYCLHIHLSRQFEKYYLANSKNGLITKGHNSYVNRYFKVQKHFRLTFNREPSLKEYVAYLRISAEMVKKIEELINISRTVSIDAPITNEDDEKLNLGMTLSDSVNMENSITDTMVEKDIKSGLWEIIKNNTNPDEYSVIWAIYSLNMSLEEYSKYMGMSRKVATNNRNSAMSKIRTFKVKKMIAERYEIGYTQAFRSSITSLKNNIILASEQVTIKNIEKELRYISYVLTNTVDGIKLLDQAQIILAFEYRLIDDNFNILAKWEKPKQGFAIQKVEQYDKRGSMIKRWERAMDAADSLEISLSNIQRCCMGRRNSAGGYVWKIVNK